MTTEQIECALRECREMEYLGDDGALPHGWQLIEERPFCGVREHGGAVQRALRAQKFVIEQNPKDRRGLVLRAVGPGDVQAILKSICK